MATLLPYVSIPVIMVHMHALTRNAPIAATRKNGTSIPARQDCFNKLVMMIHFVTTINFYCLFAT